jgi:16S rRNA pseudouridine516 synthase
MALLRLDRIITATGKKSRREVRQLVREGRILINGRPAAAVDEKIDPAQATILLDGADLGYRVHTYVLLHKPAGLLTATEDKRADTVMSLLPEELRFRLFPVGRLDKDTEGLLLLTDDGELAHRLLGPKFHVDKTYYARVEGALTEADVAAFAGGITLGDGFACRPAKLEILSPSEALVTVQEGKFHQVKRMLASRGNPVTYLRRETMGSLTLGELPVGAYRFLTVEEETALRRDCEIFTDS